VLLAGVILNPQGGFLAWLLIGLIAGAVAGRLVRGRGYGCLVDIIVGVIGAFIGGLLVGLFVPESQVYGFVGSLVVATLGAVILLGFIRLISPGRR
jgi:uncharacterized membrane protein YeaQ/YmgE (transglycosylase-associated protein family)